MKTALFMVAFLVATFHGTCQTDIGGVINDYGKVNDVGADYVLASNAFNFFAGDQVLIAQHAGAEVILDNDENFGDITDYHSAGLFEFAEILTVTSDQITFTQALTNSFDPGSLVQIVRVPVYEGDVSVVSTLTAEEWDGNIGGILALQAEGSLSLSANVDVSEKGFAGGIQCENPDGLCGGGYFDYFYAINDGVAGEKGQGIALTVSGGETGRGHLANAAGGGNKHNSGGGGGGNFSAGGIGGNQAGFCPNDAVGGIGGQALMYSDQEPRLFFGGGGGCSDYNNAVGTFGGVGGGIIVMRSGSIEGNGYSIISNGETPPIIPNDIGDGAGGGGAGGSIFLDVDSYGASELFLMANGGDGGSQNTTWNSCFAPGGGGGAGAIWISGSELPPTVEYETEPGLAGVDENPLSPCFEMNYGAMDGMQDDGLLFNLDLNLSVNQSITANSSVELNIQNEAIAISNPDRMDLHVRVMDVSGRILRSESDDDAMELSLLGLPQGAYIVQVSGQALSLSKKFVLNP